MSTVLKAKDFATDAHTGDTYGDFPYTKHLSDVYGMLVVAGVDDTVALTAAWLHDTIEDTVVRYEDVLDEFGKTIADVVYLLTDKRGKDRKERHKATYPLTAEDPRATVVKWADRTANIIASQHQKQSLFFRYKKEHVYFKETLYKKFDDPEFDGAIEFLATLVDRLLEMGPIIE